MPIIQNCLQDLEKWLSDQRLVGIFADEIAGNGSENDRQVKRQIKKLRCNSLENDANRIRQTYKSRPEVLRLMDESMA